VEEEQKGRTLAKPEKTSAPPPIYPLAMRLSCATGVVEVQSILDESGRIGPDFIVSDVLSPVMKVAALEAIRQWRFKPATADGKPIKVYYTVTVNFAVLGCKPHL
jgi:protein TonB